MRYKMMGGAEQGIHYTIFMEDVEDEKSQDVSRKEGTTKSFLPVTSKQVDVNIKEDK